MNVTTISDARHDAHRKYLEYREAYAKTKNAEDRILMRTYRQLSRGVVLLNLFDVMQTAGVDEQHRPKLAIARADAKQVWFHKNVWPRRSGAQVNRFTINRDNNGWAKTQIVDLPSTIWSRDCPVNCETITKRRHSALRAMVPLIPPTLRPKDSLENYHILWDVQGAWFEEPPKDPFLLKHIDGDLFAVVAEWDLTDLEMSVLKGLRGRL